MNILKVLLCAVVFCIACAGQQGTFPAGGGVTASSVLPLATYTDTGTLNAMAISIPGVTLGATPITACIIPANTNTGATTLSVNSGTAYPVYSNGAAVAANALNKGTGTGGYGCQWLTWDNGQLRWNFGNGGSLAGVTINPHSTYAGTSAGGGTEPTYNTAFGELALGANTSGQFNVAAGTRALLANTIGQFNVAAGMGALQSDTNGTFNTALGYSAMQLSVGTSDNVAIGQSALQNLQTSGSALNVAIGGQAMQFSVNAAYNTCIGEEACYYNQGSRNVGIGIHALYQTENANYNIAIGNAALYNSTTGNYNLGIGYVAEYQVANFTTTSASGNITATNGTSNLGIGPYAYKIAFVLNGVTGALSEYQSDFVTTDSTHREVTLVNLSTYSGPLTCTARKLYRTTVGNGVIGKEKFFLVTTIADNTTTTFVDTVSDASLGSQDSGPSGSFIVGNAIVDGVDQTAYKGGQIVFGTASSQFTEFWIGAGLYSATPTDILISASGGKGSNIAGANMVLSGGPGTGTGASGALIIKAKAAGTSGSLWNAVTEVVRFDANGLTVASLTGKPAVFGIGTQAAFGGGAGNITTTASYSTGFGVSALNAITSASFDTAFGRAACLLVTGSDNTCIGSNSLVSLGTGGDNTAIGHNTGSSLSSGNDNTLIGFSANVSSGTAQFRTVIGSGASGTVDNSITLGRSSDTIMIPGTHSTTGTRYLCVGTDGTVSASASACSGT